MTLPPTTTAEFRASRSSPPKSRLIEDILAVAGIVQAMFYGTIEGLTRAGILGHNEHAGFPWVTTIIFLGCVLPKTVGRMTAGKIWETLGARFGGAKP